MPTLWRGRGNNESSFQLLPLHCSNLGSSSAYYVHLRPLPGHHPDNHHKLEGSSFPIPPPQSGLATTTGLHSMENMERKEHKDLQRPIPTLETLLALVLS
jgi:hypothetical protein